VFILILVLALVFRIVYLIQIKNTDPLFYSPIMDALYHHDWAVSIIKGGWLGKDAFFRAPLYPYFLALLYKIFGINLLVPRIFQTIIGSFNCVLTKKIGDSLFSRKIGTIAGLIAATYPLFIYFDLELLIPSVLILFILLGFSLILKQSAEKGTKLGWFITGVVWGLAAITRPNVILFIVFLPFWLIKRLKKNAAPAIIYGSLGVVIMIIPVTIRNYAVSKEFVPIAWQGGTNFYIGNNPHSDGMTAIIPGTRKSWWGGFYDAKSIAEDTMGRGLKNSEIDRYWLNQGFDYIKRKPSKAATLFLRKTYLFFCGFEISNNRDIYFFTKLTYLKFLIFNLPFLRFPFGLLVPLALVGVWYAYTNKKNITLLLLFIFVYSLSFILFFVCARYRLPIITFLIILASFAIISFLTEIKKSKSILPPLVIFFTSFIFLNVNILKLRPTDPGLNYLTLAVAEYEKENYSATISYLHKSLHYNPDYAEALTLLGSAYKRTGKSDQASSYYLKAIRCDPTQPEPYFNLGNIYVEAGKFEEAEKLYLKAIEIDPYSARAHNNLGNIYFNYGNFESALLHYGKASKLEPNYTSPLYHAGFVFVKLGDHAKAESLWIKVLEIEPKHEDAIRALKTFIK